MKNIFLLVLALGFLSCEKEGRENIERIEYGTSFGMCLGYCKNNLSIANEKVIFSKQKNGALKETKTCTSTISVSDLTEIMDLIDQDKVAGLPETIGCPDCADGGAEWVSVTKRGKTQKIVFEYGEAPKELLAVVERLRALKETFNNCN